MAESRHGRRSRRTRTPRAERREQLLRVAERLVLESGAGALTMERLAEQAGIAKTVPYSHFANSSEVLVAVLERHWNRLDARLLTIAERAEQPVMTFLQEYATRYIGETAAERLLLRRLLQASRLDDAARAAIDRRQEARMLALSRGLERDVGLTEKLSRPLASFLLGALGAIGAREHRGAAQRAHLVETYMRAARGAIAASLAGGENDRREMDELSDRASMVHRRPAHQRTRKRPARAKG